MNQAEPEASEHAFWCVYVRNFFKQICGLFSSFLDRLQSALQLSNVPRLRIQPVEFPKHGSTVNTNNSLMELKSWIFCQPRIFITEVWAMLAGQSVHHLGHVCLCAIFYRTFQQITTICHHTSIWQQIIMVTEDIHLFVAKCRRPFPSN